MCRLPPPGDSLHHKTNQEIVFRIEESTCNGLHSIRAPARLLEEGVDDLLNVGSKTCVLVWRRICSFRSGQARRYRNETQSAFVQASWNAEKNEKDQPNDFNSMHRITLRDFPFWRPFAARLVDARF